MSDDQDPDNKILPAPKPEPWQQEIYDQLKKARAEIDLITGAITNHGTITGRFPNPLIPFNFGIDEGREGGDETAVAFMDSYHEQISHAMIYGRSMGKTELKDNILDSIIHSVTPELVFLDEWDLDYVEKDDGPRKPYWTQPIPNPQAPKPVSSPSAAKRAKLRAKRKKK